MQESIYSFEVKSIDGRLTPMAEYKDKVLLFVNVASHCGFTYQYEGLEKLYEKYKDKGFVVLGFPCNQFGAQEPGNPEEIKSFCSLTYNVKFPIFSKIEVNGEKALPLYKFLKKQKKGIFWSEPIKWNFTKFLVDRSGKVRFRFGSTTKPEKLESKIESLLG